MVLQCLLIRQRRRIMSTQIRLRRAQDKKFQRTSEPAEADLIPQNMSENSEKSSKVEKFTQKSISVGKFENNYASKIRIANWKQELSFN
uniref:Uncharacterized protein n=1 Tax=Parascaris equorum TaxID=6256 RepID=A0A914SAN9_PAREQ